MTTPPPRRSRPSSKLVPHDIHIVRKGVGATKATVYCERRDCRLDVNECRSCERFARIDVHEAGYEMLCRSCDEPVEDDGEGDGGDDT